MRTEGAADGEPVDRLTLARAEAGWDNWPAVLDILDGAAWLGETDDGVGLYLLARSLEHAERWSEAVERYVAYGVQVGMETPEGIPAVARGARAAWHADLQEQSLNLLRQLRPVPAVRSWTAAELALWAAEQGDADGVRALTAQAVEPGAAGVLWRAEADALLESGDSIGAARAFAAPARTGCRHPEHPGVHACSEPRGCIWYRRGEALVLRGIHDGRGLGCDLVVCEKDQEH